MQELTCARQTHGHLSTCNATLRTNINASNNMHECFKNLQRDNVANDFHYIYECECKSVVIAPQHSMMPAHQSIVEEC